MKLGHLLVISRVSFDDLTPPFVVLEAPFVNLRPLFVNLTLPFDDSLRMFVKSNVSVRQNVRIVR